MIICQHRRLLMDITKVTTLGTQSISSKKTEKVKKSGEKFTLEESIETPQIQAPSGITLTPIDALFLNLDQRRKGHAQAIERSDKILKELENLRAGIICGSISKETLEKITEFLQSHNQTVIEEPLRSLVLEIETRAKVELAKLEKLT